MADTYPWGSQAPQARLGKLQSQLASSERARDRYLETHRKKIAQFDEADRQTKQDIRQCQQILEKERNEANAAAVTRLLMKVMGSADPAAVEQAIKTGALEERLSDIATELDVTAPKGKKPKGAKSSAGNEQSSDAEASA